MANLLPVTESQRSFKICWFQYVGYQNNLPDLTVSGEEAHLATEHSKTRMEISWCQTKMSNDLGGGHQTHTSSTSTSTTNCLRKQPQEWQTPCRTPNWTRLTDGHVETCKRWRQMQSVSIASQVGSTLISSFNFKYQSELFQKNEHTVELQYIHNLFVPRTKRFGYKNGFDERQGLF